MCVGYCACKCTFEANWILPVSVSVSWPVCCWWVGSWEDAVKGTLCLSPRSDYLPSFHHGLRENNHGFVFYRHIRPLRLRDTGENQNWKGRETGRAGSTKFCAPATDPDNSVMFPLSFTTTFSRSLACVIDSMVGQCNFREL